MDKLICFIADTFEVEKNLICDDLNIKDLESWDSLKHMEFIVGLEKLYSINLTPEEIVKMLNVATIKDIISNHQA